MSRTAEPAAEILLVDDNPADLDLTREILGQSRHPVHLSSVSDGVEAAAFLRRQHDDGTACRPDLVLLDLNLPRKDGREFLAEMKQDRRLQKIPVVIFTTSQAESDIARSYELGANCYVSKPGNLHDFIAAVKAMEEFWLCQATLPSKEHHD
jgi:CheY-like chemotaxis protein